MARYDLDGPSTFAEDAPAGAFATTEVLTPTLLRRPVQPRWYRTGLGKALIAITAACAVVAVGVAIWWTWRVDGNSATPDSISSSSAADPRPTLSYNIATRFIRYELEGHQVVLMTYRNSMPGTVGGEELFAAAGDVVEVTLRNDLPPNRELELAAAAGATGGNAGHGSTHTGSFTFTNSTWPCWSGASSLASGPHTVGGIDAAYGGHKGSAQAASPVEYVNTPHAFRTTNLHTHGLQVAPADDDPFARVEPGSASTHRLHLPADHPSGLFWYHPHSHGSSAVQMSNGMAGLFVVRGELDAAMRSLGFREVRLPVTQLDLRLADNASARQLLQYAGLSSAAAAAAAAAAPLFAYDPLPFACPEQGGYTRGPFDLDFVVVAGAVAAVSTGPSIHWQATGKEPRHDVRYGEILWLRVLNGSPGRPFVLALDDAAFDLHLIAVDGLTLPAPVRVRDGLPFAWGEDIEDGLLLPPGGRYDLLLRAPAAPAPAFEANATTASGDGRRAVSLWSRRYIGCVGRADCPDFSAFRIASFVLPPISSTLAARRRQLRAGLGPHARTTQASGSDQVGEGTPRLAAVAAAADALSLAISPPMQLPLRLPAPPRLRFVTAGEVVARRVFVMSQHVLSPPPDAPANVAVDPASLTPTGFYVNNRTMDPARVDVTVKLGTAEEWVLENPEPGHDHPWHTHMQPFLVVSLEHLDTGENVLTQAYWTDNLWVPAGMRAVTRLRFLDFVGKTVAHCHIIGHEVAGMMIVYEVVR